MLSYCGILVLAAALQVISSEGPPPHLSFLANIPEECRAPPRDVKPHECCDVPPFLEESKLTACGVELPKEGEPHHHKLGGPPDCSKALCLLKNENLLDDNDKIKTPEITKFLGAWAETNTEFKEPVEYAKDQCLREGGPPGPPHICEADRFFFCMTGNIFIKCPKWNKSDGCKKVKEHIEKCHKYFKEPEN